MPSLGALVDEVIGILHGHTTDVPMYGSLVGAVDDDSTELALDFGTTPGAGRPNGVVEIGNELILVNSFDANTGVASLAPWSRGHAGTIAAAHAAGARVTVRPRYPRKRVIDALNQVIAASCPPLFAATDLAEIDTSAIVSLGYELPANTTRVLRVDATDQGVPTELADRRVLRNWTVRNVAGTQLLELPDWETFQTVQVTIAAEPGKLINDSDDFATVTGLPESTVDLIQFGTIARLVLGIELARQQVTTVEASNRQERIQAGSGTTISRYFQALYTQRLEQERDRLQSQYPIQLLRRS